MPTGGVVKEGHPEWDHTNHDEDRHSMAYPWGCIWGEAKSKSKTNSGVYAAMMIDSDRD
jgi:hypothetical protein